MQLKAGVLLTVCLAFAGCDEGISNVDADWIVGYWTFESGLCQPGEMRFGPERFDYAFSLEFLSLSRVLVHRGEAVQSMEVSLSRRSTGDSSSRVLVAAFAEPLFLDTAVFQVDQSGIDEITLGYFGVVDGCWYRFSAVR